MMKKSLLITMLMCVIPAVAQNWTTVTANNITDLNQQKLAAGQLCFMATDQNDNPISTGVGGGGQLLRRQYCSQVVAGALPTAFTIPNPATTQPAGVYYRVTVRDSSTGQEVLRYTQVSFSGTSFNFDTYAPLNLGTPAPLSGNAVTGNLSVAGNVSATGTVTASNIPASIPGIGSCTNQFVRGLNLAAAPTCSTVGSSDLAASLALTTPNIGAATATSISATGVLTSSGSTGLPTAGGAATYLFSQNSTPHGGALIVGDGSGWQFDFLKRIASTNTVLASIKDSGALTFGASSDAGLSRTAAGTVAVGNGTQGDASGTLSLNSINSSGSIGVGTSPNSFASVFAANNNLTSNNQVGFQSAIVANSSAVSLSAGAALRADTAAQAFTTALNTGALIQTPTVGAGSVITEWNGVRIQAAPTAGTKYAIRTMDTSPLNLGGSIWQPASSGTQTVPNATGNVVLDSATQTLTNKTLQGAGSGNSVTLLNVQGPIAALVGNSADQTVYTFTIPANTVQAGKGIRIKMVGFHSTGTAVTTYKIIIGATTTATVSASSGNSENWTMSLYNAAGVQNSQFYEATMADGVGSVSNVNTFGTAAENFANAVTVRFTFNVANTDQYTGRLFSIELIQ
jgi:hypothetical protein